MAMKVDKCVNNMNPQYLNEMFTLTKYTCDLRDDSHLERPAARLTNYGLKCFRSCGDKLWNLLLASYTIYPKKYAHGFHQGCFAGTGAIVRLPQCQ